MKKILIIFIICFHILYAQKKYTPIDDTHKLAGKYQKQNDGTTIELIIKDHYSFYIEGFTLSHQGNIKELYGLGHWDESKQQIIYKIPIYTLTISILDKDRFSIEETGFNPNFSLYANFTGVYNRITNN